MGCDIHGVIQVNLFGYWRTIALDLASESRSYDTFAVLAGVRNGSGFAGIKTGEGWKSISEPKGLPEDFRLCDEMCHLGKWLGDHSHSYLTLQEIEDWIENAGPKTYTTYGVVEYKDYIAYVKHGKCPEDWCASISGRDIVTISEQEAKIGKTGTHVRMSWERDAKECLFYLFEIYERLKLIRADYFGVSKENIRIVFGFDN